MLLCWLHELFSAVMGGMLGMPGGNFSVTVW